MPIIVLMYICICNAVTERQVRACVDAGAATLGDLQFELGVATCCGCCAATATEYLPGGRASSVCEVRSVAVPVNPLAALEPVGTPQPAANGFPIPLVAVA
ncbi:(2Fe-2S)-binding protein [Bordetella pertussis]|uniref:(2Fe-2S)-binding protein n=1 Tax=Bordetella pertussis TaxID=520 RepID=UPI00097DEF18|nr:(2Fe-2S)-binding protein [Bordetella pertussis]